MFKLNVVDVDRLVQALENFEGEAEPIINDVLHNQAGDLAQEQIYRLMPLSNKKKGAHAKNSKSLSNINGDLSVTVTTVSKFHYLYFPNDGTNTRRHVGNQQFFERGGEMVQGEIIDRCINALTNNFEK